MSPWRVIYILKSTLNGVASAINSTGLSGIWAIIKKPFIYCNPRSAGICNVVVARESSFISVSLAWIDYLVQWIALSEQINKSHRHHWLVYIPRGWNVLTDIVGSWIFYLLMTLAISIEVRDADYQMDDIHEFLPVIFGSLAVAIFSNVKVRRWIKQSCYGDRPRFRAEAGFDALFEFSHGFAEGRGLILTCETIYSYFLGMSLGMNFWLASMAKYAAGFIWGLLLAYVGYVYEPNIALADLFPDQIVSQRVRQFSILFNGLFPVITFGCLTGVMLAANEDPYKTIFSTAFALLLPAVVLRSCYVGRARKEAYGSVAFDSPLVRAVDQSLLPDTDPYEPSVFAVSSHSVMSLPPSTANPALASIGRAGSGGKASSERRLSLRSEPKGFYERLF